MPCVHHVPSIQFWSNNTQHESYVELQMLVFRPVKPFDRLSECGYLLFGLFTSPEMLDISNVRLIIDGT